MVRTIYDRTCAACATRALRTSAMRRSKNGRKKQKFYFNGFAQCAEHKFRSSQGNYLILILDNPLSLSRRQWWPGSCSGHRVSHAGRHRRGTPVGLSLKLRLKVTHRLRPGGPQPIPSLKPKPKPKHNQRPRRAGLRATDTGPLTCTVTGYGSYASFPVIYDPRMADVRSARAEHTAHARP
jgi:hypothetical protein